MVYYRDYSHGVYVQRAWLGAVHGGNLDAVQYIVTIYGVRHDMMHKAYAHEHWNLLEWLVLEAGRLVNREAVEYGVNLLGNGMRLGLTSTDYSGWNADHICNGTDVDHGN